MSNMQPRVLVTDFDGTMTKHDFYHLVIRDLLPPGTPNFWEEFRSGSITHFEGLRRYFAAIRADEATVLAIVRQLEPDPQLPAALAHLKNSGWKVVIASAGCQWYIERVLGELASEVEIHANPGHFEAGRGLQMELPVGSPFFSATHGIDKRAIVQHYLTNSEQVAFAGDGFPDADAARLVPSENRFARGDLATDLGRTHTSFRPFADWSEIAFALAPG